jgi:hypothetical protein
MDFVDKQNRAFAVNFLLISGFFNHRPNFFDAGKYRRKMDKIRLRFPGDNSSERGFSATRGTPEYHRENPVFLNGVPNKRSGADHSILADKLANMPGPHPLCQRPGRFGRFLGVIDNQRCP